MHSLYFVSNGIGNENFPLAGSPSCCELSAMSPITTLLESSVNVASVM
jgi:hypothetical protein